MLCWGSLFWVALCWMLSCWVIILSVIMLSYVFLNVMLGAYFGVWECVFVCEWVGGWVSVCVCVCLLLYAECLIVECPNTECLIVQCPYAECFTVECPLLNVLLQSVIMLSAATLSLITFSVVMLWVIMIVLSSWVSFCWVPLCSVSSWRMLLCQVTLCRMTLYWMSWRRRHSHFSIFHGNRFLSATFFLHPQQKRIEGNRFGSNLHFSQFAGDTKRYNAATCLGCPQRLTNQAWARLKFCLPLLRSIEWIGEVFFSLLFRSRIVPVWFSPFKLKMDEITGAEKLSPKLNNFILFEYCWSKKILFKYHLTKNSHSSII